MSRKKIEHAVPMHKEICGNLGSFASGIGAQLTDLTEMYVHEQWRLIEELGIMGINRIVVPAKEFFKIDGPLAGGRQRAKLTIGINDEMFGRYSGWAEANDVPVTIPLRAAIVEGLMLNMREGGIDTGIAYNEIDFTD